MTSAGLAIRSLQNFTLDQPPSCVEFLPLHQNFFVIGTYHLNTNLEKGDDLSSNDTRTTSNSQSRSGSLVLLKLEKNYTSSTQTLQTPYAVLDLHFSPNEPTTFAVAASNGTICLFTADVNDPNTEAIKAISTLKVAEPSILVLSLAWCPVVSRIGELSASCSDGRTIVLNSAKHQNGELAEVTESHGLEAWIVAWPSRGHGKERLVYSGGDDSAICINEFDAQPLDKKLESKSVATGPVRRDRKTHGAGVTAILPLATTATSEDQIVVTGSYDEVIRVLTIPKSPSSSRWCLLAEKGLGGGVWRLKHMRTLSSNGSDVFVILASCMHAGTRVVIIRGSTEAGWGIEISARFEEHESMNYASDARLEQNETGMQYFTVVSTSFYDKKICVWEYQIP